MAEEHGEASVITRRDGRVGRILLNRPKSLNALDLPMIDAIAAALTAWRDDASVHAVVIEGAGGRAFCAGGDIRAIRAHALAGEKEAIEAFFSREYALNLQIAEYPKPYVALIDGVCMGGGIGVSVHGGIRVATEAAMFAMPETAIALFPDIGATYILPRLPGHLGMYLALTGTRITGADSVHAGLATHYVPRERLAGLSAALAEDGVAALAGYAERLPPFSLAAQRPAIDQCFSADSVPEILARLEAEDSDWARATLATLRSMSPSSVMWSFAIVRAGAHRTLARCLAAELSLTRRVTAHRDFHEGVRAMVVDKDRAPKWQPARIEDVAESDIAAMFA
jgi:enoyl-CoA hydratase